MKTIRLTCGIAITALMCALTIIPAVVSRPANADVKSTDNAIIVWDGNGAGWANPMTSTIQAETMDVHGSEKALQFVFKDSGRWLGAGWNWLGFKKGPYGADISQMKYLTFWVKSTGTVTDLQINLLSNGTVADTPAHHTEKVHLSDYCPQIQDGTWHLVKIPLTALKEPQGFDAKHVCEIQMGLMADHAVAGSYIFDGIAFQR
ncbi:MAG TPA: hypothetical protein VFW40_00930 [Capsulimonadaceae bacterium]|nr:hypothetical protein [Capsulimonadaceae bacterium]